MNIDATSGSAFLERLLQLVAEAKSDTPPELYPMVLEAGAEGDEVTIIYRHAPSARIFGRRLSVREFSTLFSPALSIDRLAMIVLGEMAEPQSESVRPREESSGFEDRFGHIFWQSL